MNCAPVRPGVLKVGNAEKSMARDCEGDELWQSDSIALSWRVNGVSGATVVGRVLRGVKMLRDGGACQLSSPRLGVRAFRERELGVGVLSMSVQKSLFVGVVLGETGSSKRWRRSSSSSAGGGGRFSLSGLWSSTMAI
jgi:hypothetical protein